MLYYPISALFNAIGSTLLCLLALRYNVKSELNRAFIFLSGSIAFWSYCYFFWQLADNAGSALFWCRGLMIGVVFFPSTIFHFSAVLIDKKKKFLKYIYFFYALSTIFFVLNFTPAIVKSVEPRLFFKFWPVPGYAMPSHFFMFVACFAWSLALMFNALKTAGDIKRRQIKYIFIGMALAVIGGGSNYFLWFNIMIPPVGNALVCIYVATFFYAIAKYRLMGIRLAITRVTIFFLVYTPLLALPYIYGYKYKNWFWAMTLTWCLAIVGSLILKIIQESVERQLSSKVDIVTRDLKKVSDARNDLEIEVAERVKTEKKLQAAYMELEKTQEQLMHAEKMEAVGRMASGVAHEVKNPLGIILQGINYFESKLPSTHKDDQEILKMMKINLKRADSIISALLRFSRDEKLKMKSEAINPIIESSLDLVKHKIEVAGIRVSRELADGLPATVVDQGKIEQVFVNLFNNAIDAMPRGGQLYIRSYLKSFDKSKNTIEYRSNDFFNLGEKTLVVEVEDTGVGMDEDTKKKIFEPFFTTKGRAEGTGLGLSVTKNIMDIHRGLINVDSVKGKGTKFTLIFKLL
ncbi:MAG: ATP-binding protein [Candidatus Omnitrophica bacterium]|nr:ATP-binding protein [Candidatus Omnitrophota bacterium]